ncbi:hypothetical protein MMC14_009816, partial [Varicellaria rhodocarpa]|nr:hypothetical protein [Varicellaria rhodocarpa]
HEDVPVIGDFDSCRRKGEVSSGGKARTPDWTDEDYKFAEPENDWYGFSKIREYLIQAKRGTVVAKKDES